ncbi:MAG: IS200/IS605 family transposase [Chloroflexota bacterium]|nr:MAG: IS200/IS605 family transposase [Chloroflexota bacterium]
MSYWRLFYHIVWATRNREPLIGAEVAADLYQVIAGKATQLGAIVHAVGGIEDHVHVATSVPPKLALSEFIGQLKGSSAHLANHKLALPVTFAWQAEYGVLSFDGKQLARIIAYVQEQKQHHAQGTLIPVLERSASPRSS